MWAHEWAGPQRASDELKWLPSSRILVEGEGYLESRVAASVFRFCVPSYLHYCVPEPAIRMARGDFRSRSGLD